MHQHLRIVNYIRVYTRDASICLNFRNLEKCASYLLTSRKVLRIALAPSMAGESSMPAIQIQRNLLTH